MDDTLSEKSCPVPCSVITWGLVVALSVIVMVAVRAPPAVGVNVALMVQCAAGAIGEVHVLVDAKSPPFVPPVTMLVIVSGWPPLFVSVTLCEALVEPTAAAAYVKVVPERSAVGSSKPVPDSVMDCGLFGASSVIATEALRVPAALGVNVTLMVHMSCTASVAPHVPVGAKEKSPEFVPVTAMLEMFRIAFPVFVTVTD